MFNKLRLVKIIEMKPGIIFLVGLFVILLVFFSGCLDQYNLEQYNFAISFDPSYNLAISRLDENLCLKINDTLNQRNCFLYVAGQKADEKVCNIVPEELMNAKSECFHAVAYTKEDYAICEKTKFEEDKGKCIAYAGIKKGDKNPCKGISQEFVRGWCYTYVSYLTNNETLCEIIPEATSARPLASDGGDYENPKDRCYFFAQKCDLIKNENIKGWCELNSTGGGTYNYPTVPK